jgi:membrane protease subunit HflK
MLPIGHAHAGPPDLEAWFRKIFSKLKFQRRPTLKDLQPPTNEDNTWGWWGVIPFVVAVSILLSGIITVKPGMAVVVTRLGVYQETLLSGTHWTIPFVDHHLNVDLVDAQQVAVSGLMLTQDQNLVSANILLNYQITDPRTYVFSSQNLSAVLQAYLQAASVQVLQKQNLDFLLDKANVDVLASNIQSHLALDAQHYGIQVQSVTVQNITVPDALNTTFMQTLTRAQNQVNLMMKDAEAYKVAMTPLAVREAAALQQMANVKRASVIIQAETNAAEFNALLPSYQKDPEATAAYLPLLVLPTVKTLAQTTTTSTPVAAPIITKPQNAYDRWNAANQNQNNENAQDQN